MANDGDGSVLVSIVVPIYNEALVIREVINRILHVKLIDRLSKEIIIVDDGSSDSTLEQVEQLMTEAKVFFPETNITLHKSILNHGKGAAVRTGLRLAKGSIIVIQDGDLEYSPSDYPALLAPFDDVKVDIVYGSRFMNGHPKGMKFLNLLANRILAFLTTVMFGQKLTDEATGYKVFRKSVLKHFELKSRGFEFCPEFTGKCLRAGFRIVEVPISYNPRGILEGKKIKAKDGFIAVWWLFKAKFDGRGRAPVSEAASLK